MASAIDELRDALPGGPATLLLAIMSDKEVADVMLALASSEVLRSAQLVATDVPDADRGLPAEALARAWAATDGTNPAAAVVPDADAALDRAIRLSSAADGPLIVAGSLYLVGHVRARLVPELES